MFEDLAEELGCVVFGEKEVEDECLEGMKYHLSLDIIPSPCTLDIYWNDHFSDFSHIFYSNFFHYFWDKGDDGSKEGVGKNMKKLQIILQ